MNAMADRLNRGTLSQADGITQIWLLSSLFSVDSADIKQSVNVGEGLAFVDPLDQAKFLAYLP